MRVLRSNAFPEAVWQVDPGILLWESQIDCVIFVPTLNIYENLIEFLTQQGWEVEDIT